MSDKDHTEIYVLRHATPAKSMPNRTRPLTEVGEQQAQALVSYFTALGITAVYTSPFTRAVSTVAPFCEAAGLTPVEREDLRESAHEEEFPKVRARMMGALSEIAEMNEGGRILVCTHGGCLWSVISHFDEDFGYEDYRKLGTPDMRKIIFEDGADRMDDQFVFDLPME